MIKIKRLMVCLILPLCTMGFSMAQEKLNGFVIKQDDNCPFTIRPGFGEYGFVLINTTLSDLHFAISVAPRRLVSADYNTEKQQWILIIVPNDNNYKKYKITINSKGFKQGEIEISVKQKESICFDIDPLHEEAKPHWMLLANYGLANVKQSSLGLTIAWAGSFGGYLKVMTNGSFGYHTDLSASMDERYDYLWTNQTSKVRFSVTAGGLFAVKKLGYMYAGAGYGIRNLVWYTELGQSVAMTPGSYKGVALETGMWFNLGDHTLVSIGGLSQFPGPYYEMKVGVGYKF